MNKYKNEILKAIEIREVETKLLELFNQGLLNGTVHTCVGQELIGVFASKYLNENDFVVSNHRGHGHYIAKTGDTKGLLAELLGKVSGCSGGVGGSQHIYNTNYMSNGIQGGMVPIAAGVALARKAYESNSVSLAYIGDGTLGQGILYEAMHLSSMHSVPLVLVLENNGYSQSTSHKDNFSGSIEQRALGFGFKYFESSTFDIEDLDSTFNKAISTAREEGSPVLVHIETYRLNSHSKGDDNRYEEEIEEYKTRDLINQFSSNFINESIKIRDNINSIVEEIQADEKLVTFDKTDRYVEQDCEFGLWEVDPDEEGLRVNDLIYKALKTSLQQEDMYLLGEDICNQSSHTKYNYGGAFKVTKDLSDLFPGRVLNTSISEAGLVGLSTGIAINGNKAIAEIMFGDFCTLIIDQLQQHATKFTSMYGRKLDVPLLVRTPMGGRRAYGPTHSQSVEALFNNIIGLSVVALNSRASVTKLYLELLSTLKTPTVLIENKVLYTKKVQSKGINGYDIQVSDTNLPIINISPKESATATVFCYGGMLDEVECILENLLVEHEISLDVICPSVVKPMNIKPFLDSVKETNKLIVIEEGNNSGGFGESLVSSLSGKSIDFETLFIGSNNIIPSTVEAESSILPSSDSILKSILEFLNK